MPKKCDSCGFYDPENQLFDCPKCGQSLKFTMFAPPEYQAQEPAEPQGKAAWDSSAAKFEQLELPFGVRMTQIGAGIGIYCFISRTVMNFFFALCFIGSENVRIEHAIAAYLIFALVFHVVGALVGGAVAGAWSVNWVPQGIGVGVGIFLAPIVLFLIFGPEEGQNAAGLAVTVAVTTVFSVLGAFIGHKMIRPSRYIIS
jgi:hypothetical protein